MTHKTIQFCPSVGDRREENARGTYRDEWRYDRAEGVERHASNEQSSSSVDVRDSSSNQERTDPSTKLESEGQATYHPYDRP